MARVRSVKEVRDVALPRLRLSAKRVRGVLSVSLDQNLSLERTHEIGLKIEREVKKILPNARVIIRTKPLQSNLENTWNLIRKIIEGIPGSRGVTNIHLQEVDKHLFVDVNVGLSANSTMEQADAVSQEVERRIKAINPTISEVFVHEETALDRLRDEWTGTDTELELYLAHIVSRRFPEIKKVHAVRVRKVGNNLHVVLRCQFDPDFKRREAALFRELEQILRSAYPDISQIIIKKEVA